jgi:hypothetical protein
MGTVRWRDDGWEHKCADCKGKGSGEWWPLTEEFWNTANMARCKACSRELKRIRETKSTRKRDYIAQWRRDAAHAIALYNRDYYEANRERILEQVADYAQRNEERIRAKRRERYQRQREAILAQKKAYYQAHRERFKAEAAARYAAKKMAKAA